MPDKPGPEAKQDLENDPVINNDTDVLDPPTGTPDEAMDELGREIYAPDEDDLERVEDALFEKGLEDNETN